ncbi:MAG: SAM-dependent methyltransferase [Clostridia bacterium]|nr:SAM-dependent methyltransferase [Clostridia bacterium]
MNIPTENGKKPISLNLDRIVFIGRTFEEYKLMFSLEDNDLYGRQILDCPSGACSFTAIAAKKYNADVKACDIAYYYTPDELKEKGTLDIEHVISRIGESKDGFLWDAFKNVDGLKEARTKAINDCITDMKLDCERKRYIPVELPWLPFDNESFDLTLSAHFLFTYAEQLDYEFHRKTLQELMRVTRTEIRIFPTVDLEGKRYAYMDKLLQWIRNEGWSIEEVKVPYEFQINANTMLKLCRI